MNVRFLKPEEAADYRAIRLAALKESPTAFCSSYEMETDYEIGVFQDKLRQDGDLAAGVFGAFDHGRQLVGILGFSRENRPKRRHVGFIWGMYVLPEFRRQSIGSGLLDTALSHARRPGGERQLVLAVTSNNLSASALYRSRGFEPFGLERDALCLEDNFFDQEHMVLYL